jgi:cytochrome c-type biogenesis protein CcmF
VLIEAGHFALALALALSVLQFVLPLWGGRAGDAALMGAAAPTALAVFACVAFSFGALIYAHVVSDFSVLNVVEHSHSAKPFVYKISGVWGNHEGSMLLWVLILTLFGAVVALARDSLPPRLRANALAVQAAITTAFALFILTTSNPLPASPGRRSRVVISTRCCRIPASRSIRRSSMSAMSASRSRSRSRSRR